MVKHCSNSRHYRDFLNGLLYCYYISHKFHVLKLAQLTLKWRAEI